MTKRNSMPADAVLVAIDMSKHRGMSARAAARLFEVSASTGVKWAQQRRATGHLKAKPMGGCRPVVLAGEREWLLARLESKCDPTPADLVAALREERGVVVCRDTLWRFLKRCGKSFKKKTLFASGQDRPDVARRRTRWFALQRRVEPRPCSLVRLSDESLLSNRRMPRFKMG